MATTTRSRKKIGKSRKSLMGPGGPWHPSAPRRIRNAYGPDQGEAGWAAWCKHLARRRLTPIDDLLRSKQSPLLWALPADDRADETRKLVALLARAKRPKSERAVAEIEALATRWREDAESDPATLALGLGCLAWCQALPYLAVHVTAESWWSLLNRLVSVAEEEPSESADPLLAQVICGELRLALAYSFPELAVCQRLADSGREVISQSIADLLDGEGLIHGSHLHLLRPLLASWTRSRAIGAQLAGGWCGEEAEAQFAGTVEHALRLARSDGRQVFTPLDSPTWDKSLLKSAVRLADDRKTSKLLKILGMPCKTAGLRPGKRLGSPAFEGEWAGIAVLRSDWSRKASQLSVNYAKAPVVSEMSVGRHCLWSGIWHTDVRVNGQESTPLAKWEQVCWISDKDVDYLELELRMSNEVTIQRHILLARKDKFAFLADAVLGIQQARIDYRGTLPSAGVSTFSGEAETREGTVAAGERPVARVVPLGLPEWRCAPARGDLKVNERGLELTYSTDGQCLMAPLFIDLDRNRLGKPLTWRQLTVAQTRQIVPSDTAVGYRVQVGKSQWLIYRSLGPPDVRTVLGKNLMTEFLVAAIQPDGRSETLLEIE